MTGHSGFDELVAALRGAFVGRDGDPVDVETRPLDDAQLHRLMDGDPDGGLAVVVPGHEVLAELLPGVPVSAAVGVVSRGQGVLMFATDPVGDRHRTLVEGAGLVTGPVGGLVRELQAEASVLDLVHSVGRELTAQLDLDRMVQDATDAATKATGAAFGAFFHNLVDESGESYTRYTISGVPREEFSRFPLPRDNAVFAPTFDGVGTFRSADITQDARFGQNAPYYGMPEGHLPVHSYLAVPVVSPTTEKVLGGFFFGHPQPDRFTARHEFLAEGIARYAAIALDNARLYERERTLVTELSRSMLPDVPDVPGADVVTRYLPATTGSKIGGDWYDVIPLTSGATAFVIGDVVGHGVTAATIMGQVRTAIRSYALLELPPSEVLRNVSQLTAGLAEAGFVTCFYAVHDPGQRLLTYANAGHLPAILIKAQGETRQIGEALAQPLGVGAEFPERSTPFPPGVDLVLYTDGLVESRTRDLTVGIEWLLEGVTRVLDAADLETAWDELINELTLGRHDDDIALIHVHRHIDPPAAEFHQRADATVDQLAGLRSGLTRWAAGLGMSDERQEDLVLASYEAMSNSVEHAYREQSRPGVLEVHGERRRGEVTVTVTDYGAWKTPDATHTLRGRGHLLIDALADHTSTIHRDNGTTVTLTWTLPGTTGRPARGQEDGTA
ncbi:SpoIIE family protein phosphatase [Amycolatopsis sp. cmx-4-68]|uniref:ATP-binding SpoIIE family protein phosphatase n=1 Tax=Amycolatopsis sp. cmx-4-68 TaxID=2790938 RepID=UPI00397AAB12